MKKVTVIIPCFNVEIYIEQCLQSIAMQTYSNLQIICINDGSTDGTLNLLDKHAASDGRITIVNQKNVGISGARNAGLDLASGDYIAFVDADDWLETDSFEKVLEGHTADVICFSYFRNFEYAEVPKDLGLNGMFDSDYIQRRIIGLVDEELNSITSFDALITCWGKLYKKETVALIRFKDLKDFGTWEDGIFNIEVFQNAHKVQVVNRPFYHYRKTFQHSYTTSYKPNLYLKWKNKFEWISTYTKAHDKPAVFETALSNRICVTTLNIAFNEMNSNQTFKQIKANIKNVLYDDLYVNAFKTFKVSSAPGVWKIFYYFAKTQNAFAVTLMADIIYRYINRKNK